MSFKFLVNLGFLVSAASNLAAFSGKDTEKPPKVQIISPFFSPPLLFSVPCVKNRPKSLAVSDFWRTFAPAKR
jgi:hypothetical protein